MVKCKTLDDITYKDLWCKIGTIIDVDEKDINKLERVGAVVRLEAKPEVKVKINVIKNPIKAEEISAIKKLSKDETKEFIKNEIIPKVEKVYREDKSIKRKYSRRSTKNFERRR